MAALTRKRTPVVEREAEILRVAGEILTAEGPAGLTMESVLARLDFSKGTLYGHFTCREDLLVAFHARCFSKYHGYFTRGALFRGRTRERFVAACLGSEILQRMDPFVLSPCITESVLEGASDRWREAHNRALRENVAVFVGLGLDAVACGDLPAGSNPELVAYSVWSIWIGADQLRRSGMILRGQDFDLFQATRDRMVASVLDGFQWKPLHGEHDYEAVRERVLREVYADEAERLRIPPRRTRP